MSEQQLTDLKTGRQPGDTGNSELQMARKEIAKLLQENAQLEFVQQQTERLLSVQGSQMREGVRIEIERMDAALQTQERELQELRAKTEAVQKQLHHKIHDMQIELAEKILLLESRNNELMELKATIHRLSEQLAQQASIKK